MATPPAYRVVVPSSGDLSKSAGTYVLVGLLLQVVFAFAFLAGSVFSIFLFPLGLLGLVTVFLAYVSAYAPIRAGRWEEARTPTLIWAILSFVTLSILPGVFYLLAHGQLTEAEHLRLMPSPAAAPAVVRPVTPIAASPVVPPAAHAPSATRGAPPTPTGSYGCPRCGRPLAYVAQYRRWYCPAEGLYP